MTKREATLTERQVMEYLNKLRVLGVVNMFGASPYVTEKFKISKTEADRILILWMDNFNEEGNYKEIEVN